MTAILFFLHSTHATATRFKSAHSLIVIKSFYTKLPELYTFYMLSLIISINNNKGHYRLTFLFLEFPDTAIQRSSNAIDVLYFKQKSKETAGGPVIVDHTADDNLQFLQVNKYGMLLMLDDNVLHLQLRT